MIAQVVGSLPSIDTGELDWISGLLAVLHNWGSSQSQPILALQMGSAKCKASFPCQLAPHHGGGKSDL